ncbi:hypothetical protein [Solicola gregarius]|uniref:DUF485 domain-containing protein n=1 Tax=Solicola gregarius TaxID=2908642 RepID=A0AA46TM08_9ACTN|nr:hypothetical protein [Solicola gregarius]UYM07777.1 hypothetical protein L0C25_12120 [Solicola gregarius]
MTERVRITSPRTAGRRPRHRSGTEEIDAQSAVGEVYMRSLIRSQLRVAIAVLVAIGLGVGGIPLLVWLAPSATDLDVLGVPVVWAVLGVAIYPGLVVVGWLYVRQAERNERAFSDLIERR